MEIIEMMLILEREEESSICENREKYGDIIVSFPVEQSLFAEVF
jgi:hypothetical protein